MPKIVDHNKQKEKLAEAAWRVICRDGLERASVRNIAEEAGLAVGSMRYYFSTQSDLLAFSMQLVSERICDRLRRFVPAGDAIEDVLDVLCEMLPMDEERSTEMEVWFAFISKALVDPTLQALSLYVYDDMKGFFAKKVGQLIEQHPAGSRLDAKLETDRLFALIDGLAIHAIMHPKRLGPEQMRAVVIYHLQSLFKH
ncbi:TetR/AcrR family transcriptional regulator [Cohnella nanjingensis]|uniref:TetR family transcriptional regulator C-terminal domain-containing protein n=1 Tax=Cohnella nanjingensis TaxID=1387779 RepID=A0A7X0VH33_9BACL|nr:TetR family transcriptional regulator C-terminal domain-containing protein [Cohnella nanjingensis]MBB6673496.1 TetR family transcriptional regulator C-terminal domain-containing protein [Cohnella nanjingensis]